MKKTGWLVATSSVLFAAAAFAAASHYPVQFSDTMPNPCNGDSLLLTASGQVTVETTSNGSGFHYTEHAEITGEAVSQTSGTRYRYNFNQNTVQNSTDPQFNITLAGNSQLIGQGTAPNFELHIDVHSTVNANGEQTAFAFNPKIVCR